MANISNANGTIRFSKDFARKYGDKIKEWISAAGNNHGYGIDYISDYIPGQTEYSFSGSGRWTFDSTLRDWGLATYDSKSARSEDILRPALIESKGSVEIEFTDYEPGCEVLYSETVRITADESMIETGKYQVEVIAEDDEISYTHRSRIERGLENGYDLRNSGDLEQFLEDAKETGKEFGKIAEKIAEKIDKDPDFDGCTFDWEVEDWEDIYSDFINEIKEEDEAVNIVRYHAFV